jgi:hypothetical protein
MEKYNKRNRDWKLIDWIMPERDDDRMYYRVVIDWEQVYYASHQEEAFVVLTDLLEARDEWRLQEALDNLEKVDTNLYYNL